MSQFLDDIESDIVNQDTIYDNIIIILKYKLIDITIQIRQVTKLVDKVYDILKSNYNDFYKNIFYI